MRFLPSWSHKNTYLCATQFYVPYCTFCHSFKEKCPLRGAKTQVKYVNPGTFYYVATGMYCGVSNIRGLSLKVNALSCPTLNLPESVNKCKTNIKTYLLMQRAISTSLYADLICFVEPWLHWILTGAPRLLSTSSYSVSYRTNLTFMKTHRYEAGCVWCWRSKSSVFKSPSILILFWSRNMIFFKELYENDSLWIKTLYICVERSKRCQSFTVSSVCFFWKLQ